MCITTVPKTHHQYSARVARPRNPTYWRRQDLMASGKDSIGLVSVIVLLARLSGWAGRRRAGKAAGPAAGI